MILHRKASSAAQFRATIGILLAMVVGSGLALAQTTGSVTGAVTDQSGAAVKGAELTLTNGDTGIKVTAVSDSVGNFQFLLLPPGTYVLEVKAMGFNGFRRPGVLVEANRSEAIPVALAVGAVTQTVEVSGGAALLESSTSTLGTVMDTQKVEDLPLNGRNPEGLANLIPTVIGQGSWGGVEGWTITTGMISIGGGPPISSGFVMDGVPIDKPGQASGPMAHLAADATQEFKILTSVFSAEFGRSGGGVLVEISKAGTNAYHGVASDYLRNTDLDSNTFFGNRSGSSRPILNINQWTGVLDGPIKKDKAFFFFNYEGYRERRTLQQITTVPTALQKEGNFSQTFTSAGALTVIYDPLSTVQTSTPGVYTRTPFPGNTIPANRIVPVANSAMALEPAPNLPGGIANINNEFQSAAQPNNRWSVANRIDYNISTSKRLAVRYQWDNPNWTLANYYGNLLVGGDGRQNKDPRTAASLGYTDALTPNLLLAVNLGYTREKEVSLCPYDQPGNAWGQANTTLTGFGYSPLYAQTTGRDYLSPRGKWPYYFITDLATLGGCASDYRAGTAVGGNAAVTKILGTHTLKFGYQFMQYMDNNGGSGPAATEYFFTRGFTQGPNPNTASAAAGFGTASFLLGDMSATGSSSVDPFQAQEAFRQLNNALFVQDDWKFNQKLTLNLGLRWEYEAPYEDRFNQFTNFTPNLPIPVTVPGFAPLTGGATFATPNGGAYQPLFAAVYDHFAPRIGFAYQAASKWVVRGGYGINWIPTKGQPIYESQGFHVSNPVVTSLNGGLTPFNTLADPYPGGVPQPTGSSLGALTGLGSDFYGDLPNIRPGYVQQWNLTLQYSPWNNVLFETAYMGNHGLGLITGGSMSSIPSPSLNQLNPQYLSLGNQLNTAVANPFYGIPAFANTPLGYSTVAYSQLLRPYPQFNNVYLNYEFLGQDTYEALTAKAEKRFSQGFSLLVAYAKSKLLDQAAYNEIIDNYYNLRLEKARSPQDIPQRLVITFLWKLPFGTNAHGFRRQLLNDWNVTGIVTEQSGSPLALIASSAGVSNARPNVVPGCNPNLSNPTLSEWFNTTCFAIPAAFSFGNSSRTIANVSGPPLHVVNASIFKNFVLRERLHLEARLEGFNVFNTPNFGSPGTTVGSSSFGVISSNGTILGRELQLGLRLTF